MIDVCANSYAGTKQYVYLTKFWQNLAEIVGGIWLKLHFLQNEETLYGGNGRQFICILHRHVY
jgi:hypothetical protein